MDAPPLAGADHDRSMMRFPGTARTAVDAGTVIGIVTALDGVLAGPDPTTFDATTVNVYDTPFTNPVTTHDRPAPSVEHDPPPDDAVTVYPVTGDPPSDTGADHDTTT